MRKTVRMYSEIGPVERLGHAIQGLPDGAKGALRVVAEREDLRLVAGIWEEGDDGDGGCLVANVVRTLALRNGEGAQPHTRADPPTLDLRILELLPELSSRDLNRLIVAWDEAAAQDGRSSDAALRRLLRGALHWAGVPAEPRGAPVSLEAALGDPVGAKK